jgi:uncharacterized membrane protein YccF (DUF307 family)
MRTLGNIIWHIPFLGFLSALGTFLVGGLFVISIIGSPIGLGLIQLSKFLMTPFSSAMVSKRDLRMEQNTIWMAYSFIIRIIYFPFGLILAVITVFQIVGLFITIIGIPVALILAKSLSTYFNPVNKICVAREVQSELKFRKAQEQVSKNWD